jgi:hypothetical protein
MARGAIAEEIRSALLEIEEDLYNAVDGYETFTWKGASIRCVPNFMNRGSVVVQGGHEHMVQYTLFVRREHFLTADSTLHTVDSELYTADNETPVPVAGKFLDHRGKTFRIVFAGVDGANAYFKLDLADKHSGQ